MRCGEGCSSLSIASETGFSYQLSVASFQLSAISCQLSAAYWVMERRRGKCRFFDSSLRRLAQNDRRKMTAENVRQKMTAEDVRQKTTLENDRQKMTAEK